MNDPCPSNLPSVSVVTPAYNAGRFIGDAVRSVVEQDWPSIEYVVMDAGSVDQTSDVLRSFEARSRNAIAGRFRWVSEPDEGQADALNQGFARTGGEILGWLNADDVYTEGAVRAAAEYFRDHPDVALVYGDADFIDADGRHVAPCAHVEPFNRRRLLHYSDFIVQPAAFFRRSAFEAVGGLDASLHWTMDYDLWLKIAASGRQVAYLPRVLAHYRWLPGTKTASGGWDRLDEVDRVARRHGGSRPAYFTLERVNLALQDARRSLADGDVRGAAGCCVAATACLLSSRRALASLFSLRTWKIIHTGQVLRARAVALAERSNRHADCHADVHLDAEPLASKV